MWGGEGEEKGEVKYGGSYLILIKYPVFLYDQQSISQKEYILLRHVQMPSMKKWP